MTAYFVLGAVAAFLLGVWLGLPGKYGTNWRRTDRARSTRASGAHDPRHLAELEGALARSGAESKSAKRHFTLFSGLLSTKQRASARRRGGRALFRPAVGTATRDGAATEDSATPQGTAATQDSATPQGCPATPDGASGDGDPAPASAPEQVDRDQKRADERA